MNVMHLISGGDGGGAKTHLFQLLDKLKLKSEVCIGCLMKGQFYKEILSRDVDTILFEQKNRFDLSVIKDIIKYTDERKIDILHVHGARANFIAGFLKKRLSIPIVTTMHSDYLLDFDTLVKKLVFTNLNAFSLKKIDYFIAVSENFKEMLISRNFKPNNIYTVYNGMDFSAVPESVTSKREFALKYNIELNEKYTYVGIAARFDRVKGVDIFIKGAAKAYRKNKNLRFLIAGDGHEKDNLKRLVRESGMENVIKFLGFVTDIYGFLNFIDINTLTSLCESFPYSMLEGAAMKLPIVASNVGGIPSLVRNGETGFLFERKNDDELSEKLILLASDKKLIQTMGEKMYDVATMEFNSEVMACRHIKIYNDIIKSYKAEKKYDFVLSGYFGFNNSGDDALLMALIKDIREYRPSAKIAVLSKDPIETEKSYKVDAFPRMSPITLLKLFSKSRVLLSGGGSLIQDETSSKSLWYYLAIIWLAKKKNMKIMQVANGIGPVNGKYNRRLSTNIINSCVDCITLREDKSLAELHKMGVRLEAEVTADPAVLLKSSDRNAVSRLFKECNIPEAPYICVALRRWKGASHNFDNEIAKALDYCVEAYGKNVVFLPMQYPADVEIADSVCNKMKHKSYIVNKKCKIEDTIGIIKYSSLVIAMRLHSLVYAVSNGVGIIAIKYDPKIDGFMDYFRQELIENVTSITAESLIKLIDKFFGKNNEAALEKLCGEMKIKAKRNAALAVKLLENK